jgi:Na+/H+-dicarboxylate symporter/ABC-type amino acid transport substrate-binding protein
MDPVWTGDLDGMTQSAMSFSTKILVGLAAGIGTGIVLGELVAPLRIVADGFVRLLQMTVLPYVTVSIISSLGALSLAQARALGLRGGAVLLATWGVAFAVMGLMPLAFPHAETASFFSTALLEQRPAFDFIDLYIPANPFNALANNIVPAVVLFSVVIGVALIGVEQKETLLDVLRTAAVVISRATRAVVSLTPYGLFAIGAVAAGTLTLEQMERIQIYLLTYVAIALIVALWLLPGLVSLLTGIPMSAILGRTRDSLIVAFVAGDLFIVLPALIESCKDLLSSTPHAERVYSARTEALTSGPDVIVPVSFNFPHTGKLLSLSFIPFAAWFADASLRLRDYPQLFGAGLLSFFGSLNSAVPFLLDLFHLPADTFQLFVATGVINSRFGTLVAAVHTVAIAILGGAALTARIRWEPRRLAVFGLATLVLVVGTLGGLRLLFGTVLRQEFAGADTVYGMRMLLEAPPARFEPALTESPPAEPRDVLDAIRSREVLRVLVLPDRMPFAFENRGGELVGMDVELANALARDLGVGVRFFQVTFEEMRGALSQGTSDIAMSGVVVTADRAADLLFSSPYLDETLAFVTRDHLRDRFRTWGSINELGAVRIGVPDSPTFVQAVKARAPRVEVVPLRRMEDLFNSSDDLMAYVLPAERGSVMTLLHPAYSVIVPQPDLIKLPIAYPVARKDERWVAFVNTWLDLKRRDGTIDALYRHWVLGEDAVPQSRRWSVLRNVLGWVE